MRMAFCSRTVTFLTDPAPLSVALVIDQSVTTDTMEKINDSLSALQGAFSPYDEVAVFTYNNGVKEQTTFTAAQSARLGAVLEQSKGIGRDPLMGLSGPLAHDQVINNMPIDGVADSGHQPGTLSFTVPKEYHTLNDAILAAAKEVARADYHRRTDYLRDLGWQGVWQQGDAEGSDAFSADQPYRGVGDAGGRISDQGHGLCGPDAHSVDDARRCAAEVHDGDGRTV